MSDINVTFNAAAAVLCWNALEEKARTERAEATFHESQAINFPVQGALEMILAQQARNRADVFDASAKVIRGAFRTMQAAEGRQSADAA